MNGESVQLDRLLDTLLEEELGGECPPDLAQRILDRAAGGKALWARFAPVALSAAAAAALIVAGWLLLADRYPASKLSGGMTDADREAINRGADVVTGAEPAILSLGGYCRIEIRPASQLQIEGAARAEEIRLMQGEVLCEIERGKGTFTVRTDLGSVEVTGTKFVTGLREEKEGRKLFVRVLAGSVVASGTWGDQSLQAGDEAMLPPRPATAGKPAETMTGTLVPADNWRPPWERADNTSLGMDAAFPPEFRALNESYLNAVRNEKQP